MEGLMTRVAVAVGVFGLAGAWLKMTPRATGDAKTEDDMIAMAPTKVGKSAFIPGDGDTRVSYKMDEKSYRWLTPYGIVARRYPVGADSFDVVLIASASRSSFHDPHVCFSAQNWTIFKSEASSVETKSRGKVPFMLIHMTNEKERNKVAAYFYKGPGGFYGDTQSLKAALFWEALMHGHNSDGVFYRIIPDFALQAQTPEAQKEQEDKLKQFIADYLESAKESSDGYF